MMTDQAPQSAPLLAIAPYLRDPCFYAIEHWLTICHELEATSERQKYLMRELKDPRCEENLQAIPVLRKLIVEEALFGPTLAKYEKINFDDLTKALLIHAPDENKVHALFTDPDFMQTATYAWFVAPKHIISACYAIKNLASSNALMHAKVDALWNKFKKTSDEFEVLATTSPLICADLEQRRAAIEALEAPPAPPQAMPTDTSPRYSKGYPISSLTDTSRASQHQQSSQWVDLARREQSLQQRG